MCGKNHTCVEFTTQEVVLEVVGQKHTCVGKTTVNLCSCKVEKTKRVVFIKHIPNTNVCGKSHTCLLKDKHVCHFPYKRWYFLYLQLYFVFFKRIYYIISPSVISEVTMQCQKSETSSNQPWKKSPVWEFPHMCGKNHTG